MNLALKKNNDHRWLLVLPTGGPHFPSLSFGWSSSPHRRKSSGPAAKKEEDEDDAEDSKSRVKTKDHDGSDDNESGDESKGKNNDADELVRKARYNLESLGN